MTIEENKAIVRRWLEVFNTGELGPLEEIIARDYVLHNSSRTIRPDSGPEWYAQYIGGHVRQVLPDFQMCADLLLAVGDKVIGRWTCTGTQLGESRTPWDTPIPPSGKRTLFTCITIARLESGKIAEEWWEVDTLGELRQMGALPAPVPTA